MEVYEGQVCLSYEDLTPAVMSYSCLEKMAQRKRVERVVRGGGEGSVALFRWSSLPLKYREVYVRLYGDPAERVSQKEEREAVLVKDDEARRFYAEYRYVVNGVELSLTEKLQEEYVVNASVARMLLGELGEREGVRHACGNRKPDYWKGAVELCELLRRRYGHTLPASETRLRKKLAAFRDEGYAALVSGKIGNRNTVKITPEGGELLVALKRSRVPVLTDSQIFAQYNREASGRGWKSLQSLAGMSAWLNSPSVMPLWYDAVHGEQAARQRFGRKHQTVLPGRRDSLWYGDGTKLNLYYRDEAGNVRTTQVYEVIDAMSEVLLGYHISDTEDYEAQYHAYRMAIQVSGHKPYEIVHDNQGGHKRLDSEGLFSRICHVHRTTMPYNGESKTIESVFGRFQQQVLHKDWRFTGQNVTARKSSSRPNLEFIEANKDSLYTLEELKAAYASARQEWNSTVMKGHSKSRWEEYQGSVNGETPVVTAQDMVEMFWVTAERMITFTDSGLVLTVKGRERRYEVFEKPGVPDHAWRSRHTWEKFVVKYDPYDMGSVRLYTKEKDVLRFCAVAEPYIVIHRAIQDQAEGDAKFIRQEQAANLRDRVERQVKGKAIAYKHGTSPEQHGLRTPDLKGVPAAVQREVDRRTGRYSLDSEAWQLGRKSKEVSLQDWREVEERPAVEKRTAASKL